MEIVTKIKTYVTCILSILTSLLGILAIPVLLVVACNITDYITAVLASPKRGQEIDSSIGIAGITKKVSMWLLIVVAALVDILIKYATSTMGMSIPFEFLVACVVAIWLVCNEMLSILENLSDIGVPMPDFLGRIVVYIKTQVERSADEGAQKNDENK